MKVNIKIVPNDTKSVSKAIILDKDYKVLFLKRRVSLNKKNNKKGLDLPGGHIREGEKLEDGLKREVKEETQINISNISYFKKLKNQHFFLIKPEDYDFTEITLSHEHEAFFFLDPEEIQEENKYTRIASEALTSVTEE